MRNTLLAIGLFALCGLAQAQASAPSSPAKKELVTRVLQAQQPAIEALAGNLAQEPAAMLMQQAGQVMQSRIPPDKREAVAKEIQADIKKYVEEAVPLVRERAVKLAPSTIGAMLEEKLSEDELRQIVTFLESAANKKFVAMNSDLLKALGTKLVAEVRPLLEPKVKTMDVFPAGTHIRIVYPAALVRGALPEARAFLDFLSRPASVNTFVKFGFVAL